MIKQLRIDERLIHGQIVTQWSKVLTIDTIVVANDEVAKDEVTKKVLLMTAPVGKKVTIRSVAEVIKLLDDPRSEKMNILLICDNPQDAYQLAKGLSIQSINVGNFTKKKAENKEQLTPFISVTDEDLKWLHQLTELDAEVFVQILPTSNKEKLIDLLKS